MGALVTTVPDHVSLPYSSPIKKSSGAALCIDDESTWHWRTRCLFRFTLLSRSTAIRRFHFRKLRRVFTLRSSIHCQTSIAIVFLGPSSAIQNSCLVISIFSNSVCIQGFWKNRIKHKSSVLTWYQFLNSKWFCCVFPTFAKYEPQENIPAGCIPPTCQLYVLQ